MREHFKYACPPLPGVIGVEVSLCTVLVTQLLQYSFSYTIVTMSITFSNTIEKPVSYTIERPVSYTIERPVSLLF